MNKFTGLKDENGKDVILVVHEGFTKNVFKIEYPQPVETFKAGEWCIGRDNSYPGEPRFIYDPEMNFINFWNAELTEKNDGVKPEFLRHCTPEEVDNHLKKLCEKYTGKKVRSAWNDDEFKVTENKPKMFSGDILLPAEHDTDVYVFYNGKWAEIAEEKKKLPMLNTKQDVIRLVEAYSKSEVPHFIEFLNQYED